MAFEYTRHELGPSIHLLKKPKTKAKTKQPSPSEQRPSSLSNDRQRQSVASDHFYWSFNLVCGIYELAGTIEGCSRN